MSVDFSVYVGPFFKPSLQEVSRDYAEYQCSNSSCGKSYLTAANAFCPACGARVAKQVKSKKEPRWPDPDDFGGGMCDKVAPVRLVLRGNDVFVWIANQGNFGHYLSEYRGEGIAPMAQGDIELALKDFLAFNAELVQAYELKYGRPLEVEYGIISYFS